jgi:putative two-component system response regulator
MMKKLLLVQNQDNLRQLMGAFFSQNFEVVGAKTGLEAMSRLGRGFIPDVIVVDAGTPELTGLQLVMNLRYSGMFGHIPVVMMGALPDGEDQALVQQLGIRAVFGNTFDPMQLRERVTQLSAIPGDYAWAGATAA